MAPNRPPTLGEAERALYMDFEGTAVDPPSLLGVCWSDRSRISFHQYVLEPALWPAAGAGPAAIPGAVCTATSAADTLNEIRDLAQRDGRRLYAWSQHELDCIRDMALDPELVRWFEASLVNARLFVSRWRRRAHPAIIFPVGPRGSGRNALANYLHLIGYEVPKAFGAGHSADRIRTVRTMLVDRGGDYAALTPTTKAKWTKALRHNWHDCNGLRSLVCTVATETDA